MRCVICTWKDVPLHGVICHYCYFEGPSSHRLFTSCCTVSSSVYFPRSLVGHSACILGEWTIRCSQSLHWVWCWCCCCCWWWWWWWCWWWWRVVCCTANACQEDNSGCSHTCIDTYVSHICTCPQGYQLAADARICEGNLPAWLVDVLSMFMTKCPSALSPYVCQHWLSIASYDLWFMNTWIKLFCINMLVLLRNLVSLWTRVITVLIYLFIYLFIIRFIHTLNHSQ